MKTKTLHWFLKELARTPRNWRVYSNGVIRMKRPRDICPISALGIPVRDFDHADDIGKALGLPRALVNEIIDAADNEADPRGIRPCLLKACGLKGD